MSEYHYWEPRLDWLLDKKHSLTEVIIFLGLLFTIVAVYCLRWHLSVDIYTVYNHYVCNIARSSLGA